jgi:hypothetical protein
MHRNRTTRRNVLRIGASLASGGILGIFANRVTGQEHPLGRTGDRADDETDNENLRSRLWPRLYSGTASVELTYLQYLDRTAFGEFDVDIRFEEPEGLEEWQNLFVLALETTALRSGDVVVNDPSTYISVPDIDRTEGAFTFYSDVGAAQYWSIEFDEVTGSVSGTYNGLPAFSSRFLALEPLIFEEFYVTSKLLETQSTVSGTIGTEELSLIFDFIDEQLTVRHQATVTATRVA